MFKVNIERIFAIKLVLVIVFCVTSAVAQHGHDADKKTGKDGTGVLLLAHGGNKNWNSEVAKLGSVVDQTMPTEIAFGMASRKNIQQAVDKLAARGVGKIIAVPLFISSHSSVITSTEYLLGQRAEAPPALAIFAKMDHGSGGHGSHGTTETSSADGTTPVKSPVPIRMLSALGSHPLVAEILLSRATTISREPKKEVVVLVAHGPVSDAENNKWLGDMTVLAESMRGKSSFKRIEYLTVRDDAPEPIRAQATADFRAVVKKATDEGSNVLIVPLLLSFGGIERGIIKRLEGLEYKMTGQALLPDERLAKWVLLTVNESKNSPK
jgi:sirohydrochlorin ferrochelatase